jgi:DNA-binding response OmpR family regulator
MDTKRILLIDDEREIRRLFKKFLSNNGFIVDTAKDGKHGLERIEKGHYDLILLDLILPDCFGGDLYNTIRVKTTTAILILTASDSELHHIKSLNSGADDYIQKSISMEVILAKIKANLRREVSKEGGLLVKEVDYQKATISDWAFIPEKKS